MTHPGLHAIVLNYRQLDESLACVAALRDAGVPEDRILVVDNGSPDGSGEALEAALRGPRLLRLTENGGFGAGNNAAFETLWRAPGPPPNHVFIVNPDVRVCGHTLEALTDVLAADGRRGGATCVQCDPDDPDRLDRVFKGWLERRGVELIALEERRFLPLESLLGAAMMLTREAIERVGGFDPLYFMYAEEEDLARRLRYHGFEIGLACEARVVHGRPYRLDEDESRRRAAEQRTSRFLFTLKDPFHGVAYNVWRTLWMAVSYLAHALTSRESSVRSWWTEMVWIGRRMLPALAHRRREMRGRAHLELGSVDASRNRLLP